MRFARSITESKAVWYASHVAEWNNCKRCPLHISRRNVCLFRGRIPARFMFIGEGPGDSEDLRGTPFVGPAGQKLEELLTLVGLGHRDYCISNILGCLPLDDQGKTRPPEKLEARTCNPRLQSLIAACEPKLIFALGLPANKYLGLFGTRKVPVVMVNHPSHLLRLTGVRLQDAQKRWILTVQQAIAAFPQ